MPIPFNEEQIADYLFSKSVMDAPRSLAQQVKDFLFGRTLPEQFTNAFSGPLGQLGFARVAVKPELQSLARLANTEGLGSHWFRGQSGARPIENIMKEGFLERSLQQKFGEPLGVSLTSNPDVAAKFALANKPPLRVAVLSKPEEVLDLSGHTLEKYGIADPEKARATLRLAHRYAMQSYRPYRGNLTVAEIASQKLKGYMNPNTEIDLAQHALRDTFSEIADRSSYNKNITDYLRTLKYNAIAYSPERYGEFELRMLDPKKAIPLGYVGSSGKVGKRTVHNILQDPDIMQDTKFLVRELIHDFGDRNLNALPEKDFMDLVKAKATHYKMGPIVTRKALWDIEQMTVPNYDKKVINRFEDKFKDFFSGPSTDFEGDTPKRLSEIYNEKPGSWYLEKQEAFKPNLYDTINLQQFGKELEKALGHAY